jgi:signal-transduction protein with cAMP-binding, CBS, and nucleotidyltransferase domain
MMRVSDVMTGSVQTILPTTSAEDAWHVMRTKRIHHLVVVKGSSIVGILSDRDAGGRQGAAVRRNRHVADLMTMPVVTVPPTTTVRKAANLMRGRSIGCLVVAQAGRVTGIVTVSDLLELVGRGLDRQAATSKRWTLKHRGPRAKARKPVMRR